MSFWGELKRRNVYKVGVAYAIVAWLIIQFAAIAFPHLDFPSWAVPFVIIILIIGFPVVLIIAWAFEVTPEGIKRTKEVPLAESITHLTGQKLNYIVTGLLVLAVGFLAVKVFFLERRAIELEVVSTETEQATVIKDVEEGPNTIAVLPFVDISPEKDQEYFVDGLSEELLNTLAQIPDLTVIARTSSFSFKGSDKKVNEIANELGVDNILEGSVRKAGDALRITAQLVKGVDGSHLWSKTYDRELKDIFAIQEDIATAVADELKITLGVGKSFKQLGGTDNEKAYELYLVAQGQYNIGESDRGLKSIDEAIKLDPKFALAWATKAILQREDGYQAAQKAIEIAPNLAIGYYSLGFTKTCGGDWIGAELYYRKALELTTDPSLEYKVLYPHHYACVANFKRANEIYAGVLRSDPLNQMIRSDYMYSFVYLGDIQKVKEEYARGKEILGNQWFYGDLAIWLARFALREDISLDEILQSGPYTDEQKERIKSYDDYLIELYKEFPKAEGPGIMNFLSIPAAYFGDADFALDAMEKAISADFTTTGQVWLPVFHEVRQLQRFKKLIRKIGLVDYWEQFGWPDLCRPLDNGDFECD